MDNKRRRTQEGNEMGRSKTNNSQPLLTKNTDQDYLTDEEVQTNEANLGQGDVEISINGLVAGTQFGAANRHEFIKLELQWAWEPTDLSIPKGSSVPKKTRCHLSV